MIRASVLGLVVLLVSACGVSRNQVLSTSTQGLTCSAAKSQIETFMSRNQSCNSDSDCNTEYGGCIVLVFNNSTDPTELYRLKNQYDTACVGQGLCGIPPGTPKCENRVCISSLD